jgi:hypothetical protein
MSFPKEYSGPSDALEQAGARLFGDENAEKKESSPVPCLQTNKP